MNSFNDLIISAIVAVVSWLTYDHFGVLWAAVVLVSSTVGFIWWNSRKRSEDK